MAELKDYWNGNNYVDEDGCVISEEEAQEEVDFQNERFAHLLETSKEEQWKNTN